MRVVFLGNAAWSVPTLEALARSSHEVEGVLTRVPRPAGRGNRLRRTPVAEAADRLSLPVTEVATVTSGPGLEALRSARPEALVVVAYGEILPEAVLDIPTAMPVNVHFSLLPELRGAAPVQRAILQGMVATGVTTIRMDRGMDTGPILLRAGEAIEPEDDGGSLGARLAAVGARLLVDTVDRLAGGDLEEHPQDDAAATVAPKLRPQDRVVVWSEPAEVVVRRVRAMAPRPGASTHFRGRTLKVLRASSRAGTGPEGSPGRIAAASNDGLVVGAGDGAVTLELVQPEGRRPMSGGAFVRGYRPEVDELLG